MESVLRGLLRSQDVYNSLVDQAAHADPLLVAAGGFLAANILVVALHGCVWLLTRSFAALAVLTRLQYRVALFVAKPCIVALLGVIMHQVCTRAPLPSGQGEWLSWLSSASSAL